MAGTSEKYIVSGMSTVIIVPIDGINLSRKEEIIKLEQKVEKKVREIVNELKASHEKFVDPDFGPNDEDEFGAISLYGKAGKPDPAGSKYPAPESLIWERPQYADSGLGGGEITDEPAGEEEEEEEDDFDDYGFSSVEETKIFCNQGQLFVDGSSSGDVIQGQLGDCWFLSALAVLGTNNDLLEQCFWKRDEFREYGLYVLRFYKDCSIIYVIVDDRLPARGKDGRLIFAYCKDPNELWVPLIEKGYAKLFGCYKALIGGYTHYGLADMTGFCPRLVVFREGFLGYSEAYSPKDIWEMLNRYSNWKCLMGCSIQPNPKEKNKVEADAGMGLHMSHAYSFLKIGEILVDNDKVPYSEKVSITEGNSSNPAKVQYVVRLVKLRNPWGRGEWEGAYSDNSPEWKANEKQIKEVFNKGESKQEEIAQDANDGAFLMPFQEWLKYYTSLFVAINFPKEWCGKRTQGSFSGETGGNRDMGTWISNPRFKFRLEPDERSSEPYRSVFVGIYIKDSRMSMGFDYYKDPLYATPITFDIVSQAELSTNKPDAKAREIIPNQPPGQQMKQPPYNFGTTQLEVQLKVGEDYYIVPSLYRKNQPGMFFLNVFADVKSFFLEGATTLVEAQEPMVIGSNSKAKTLPMSIGQFYEKKEALRERIVSESQRLNLSKHHLEAIFKGASDKLTLPQFKKRMMDLGFQLADFPDDDLVVLDIDNDGTISPQEFVTFFEDGQKFSAPPNKDAPVPKQPVDDLLYKAIDLSGELKVQVYGARSIREPGSWIANNNNKSGEAGNDFILKRGLIKYSPSDAQAIRTKAARERWNQLAKIQVPDPASSVEKKEKGNGNAPTEPLATPQKTDKPGLQSTHTPRALASNLNASIRGSQTYLERATMGSVISEISQTKTEAIKQAGTSAGAKLHSDSQLQKGELSRTKNLALLRSYQQKMNGDDRESESQKLQSESFLRRKTMTVSKVKVRDFSKDIDAQILLNYFPNPKSDLTSALSLRNSSTHPLTLTQANTGKLQPVAEGKNELLEETVFHHFAAFYDEMPGGEGVDLWDYLIDCVITIVDSRSKSSSAQYQAYQKMRQRKQITSSILPQLNPEAAIATTIPTPAIVKGGQTAAATNKLNKGHTPTPRSQRRAPGTASVATIHSKAQQRNNLIEAKDKLQQLQQEQGTVYEEVYRRLVSVPTIDQQDLYGEKKSSDLAGSSSSSEVGKVSATITANLNQLYLLFLKFDKNRNGCISKSEFQLVFKEMNIEFTTEDCDIFFHRFSTEKNTLDNIDWQAFLTFFQSRLLISPLKQTEEDGTADSTHLLFSNEGNNSSVKIINLLLKMKHIFSHLFELMRTQKVTSIDHVVMDKATFAAKVTVNSLPRSLTRNPTVSASKTGPLTRERPFLIPDNAIFQSLSNGQAKHNLAILKSLGLGNITLEDLLRINRIFDEDLKQFMSFMQNDLIPDNDIDPLNLSEIVSHLDLVLAKEMSLRIGYPIIRPMNHLAKGGRTSVPNTPRPEMVAADKKTDTKATVTSDPTNKAVAEAKVSPRSVVAESKAAANPPPVITIGPAVIPLALLNQTHDLRKSKADGSACTMKVWNCLNHNHKDPFVTYDALLKYFQDLLDHSHLLHPMSSGKDEAKGSSKENAASINREFYGVKSSIFLGLIIDSIIYSDWNRVSPLLGATTGTESLVTSAGNYLSMSGLDAYLRYSRIQTIEKKLKYLLLLERNLNSSFTNLLIHVCVNVANQEMIIIGHDPINNNIYKLQCKEERLLTAAQASAVTTGNENNPWKDLPVGEKIKQSILDFYFSAHNTAKANKESMLWDRKYIENQSMILQNDAFYLYNPFEMPFEDHAITQVIARLKLVRKPIVHNQPYQLILAESPVLVHQMKELLDAHAEKLPFFYILNDLCLRFEIDYHQLQVDENEPVVETSDQLVVTKKNPTTTGSVLKNIRHVIFNTLRSLKKLEQFFISLKSSLMIILNTYNSTIREILSWDEFLLHLLNYRNCFFTIKLLPDRIKTSQYLYLSPEQRPAIKAGQEAEEDEDDEEEGEPMSDVVKAAKEKYQSFYASKIDYDGLPHPSFYQLFSFFYEQSKLTSCAIITTEVVKMNLEEVKKYVMLIVREGKRKRAKTTPGQAHERFWFLTVYDPRSATEYQCGVQSGCDLYQQLYASSDWPEEKKFHVETVNNNLRTAAEGNRLILGPAITPRVEIQVFNHKDTKCQELIGETQISISSVLSNSGVGEKLWTTLIYKMEKEAIVPAGTNPLVKMNAALSSEKKRIVTLPAGELEIELSFRRSLEMESDQMLHQKQPTGGKTGTSRMGTNVRNTPLPSARGDQDIPKPKELSREKARLSDLENENKNLLAEISRLKGAAAKSAAPSIASQPSSSPSPQPQPTPATAASSDLQAVMQKYQDLLKEKSDWDTRYSKVVAERDATREEVSQLNQKILDLQKQPPSQQVSGRKEDPAPSNQQQQQLEKQLQQLAEENKKLQETNEALKKQMAQTVNTPMEPAGRKDSVSTRTPPTADNNSDFLILSHPSNASIAAMKAEGSVEDLSASLSLIPNQQIDLSLILQDIFHFLAKKHEKKSLLKAYNGAIPSSMNTTSATAPVKGSTAAAGTPGGNTTNLMNGGGSSSSSSNGTAVANLVLGPLFTLLKPMTNIEGYVTYKQLQEAFLDCNIFIENELMVCMVHQMLGNQNNKNQSLNRKYPNSILLTDFNSLLIGQFQQFLKTSGLSLSASMSRSKLRNSFEAAKVPTLMLSSNDDGKVALRSSTEREKESDRREAAPESKKTAAGGPNQQRKTRPASAMSSLNVTAPAAIETRVDLSNEDHKVSDAAKKIDWSKMPLPEHWERRFHEEKGRFVYIDHQNKKTQWHHPDDPNAKRK